jgi:Zn-dependent M28 family amino/carboxypeptidase
VVSTIRSAAVATVTAAVLAVPAGSAFADSASGQAAKLRKDLTVQGMKRHAQALQNIATANGGTRASGTPGYAASVSYVVGQLRSAGYRPVVQPFDFAFFQEFGTPTFERTSPSPRAYVAGSSNEFSTMTYSGSGDVTAATTHITDQGGSAPGAGCEAGDFAGFPAGNVALIQRGSCAFKIKATNAQTAGAGAVVIYNNIAGPLNGTLGSPGQNIPVIGTLQSIGQEQVALLADGPVTLHVKTTTESEIRETYNVLADTRGGDSNRVVVQGSHLDSRLEGPGINDNGSGSGYNLESAIQIAKNNIKPKNTIRFAWWGAEELNLLGSTHYVNSLSDADFAKIMLNLNHDMIASPNFVRFVYDGDGSDTPAAGPAGSAQIEQVFLKWFQSQRLATTPTAFDGRSDYGPFIARGAPAGGLFTGAEVIKTAEQAATYGGVAGIAYDPCYHQACDTIANINDTAFKQMADGAATALVTFGMTKQPVTATTASVRSRRVSRKTAAKRMARTVYRGAQAQR